MYNFVPGSIIYNQTDDDGWCFVAFCNETCGIEKKSQYCGTTSIPATTFSGVTPTTSLPSPPTTLTTSSTITPPPLPVDCNSLSPPRKNGESWKPDKCSTETCIHGTVHHNYVHCEPVTVPVCVNNLPPVKVYDENGCCFKYDCQCTCSGFGDPHYITFDGTYYGFQGNCSYVLMKEIHPKYNFSVIIDDVYCDARDGLSCPQSLTVYYKSYEIFMSQKVADGIVTNLLYVNQKRVILPYQNSDLMITESGIESLLVIPAINAQIYFTGLMFSISLPWEKFHGNTEGQCGTCDNNRSDDCRLPNGTIDSSCPDMAHYWHIHDKNAHCVPPLPPPTPVPHCDNAICKIIESKLFEQCHKIIPYEAYTLACNFDVCHMNSSAIGCASLKAYADQCALAGVCIDWRAATNGICTFKCQEPKVYQACGPQIEPTCDARFNQNFIQETNAFKVLQPVMWEGCYCPPGTTQLSPKSNVCVESCGKDTNSNHCLYNQ
ncbi:intestinal mucin-like protein [Chanos chanos]|uniref:Intestinal mucin-like protein n=1 Tax=Chanos chanos TaxID=29144 RepID=A0A6J2UNX3_CHACN|nr:intestinal mucin-like protein [Chanos chanos]